ncbi:acyl-ACP desaturase [Nocardia sp. CA2R105]|uniref:acyl-ACP desaturase n=1 Tax=Nocardia coffeae TaxID=2873381 RepID=UPI001CA6386A|nr:acyl-ACP desaturase [Nocardia coffeae]MBY8858129.1 acyl-ACP desaturase [Nocardia coffeae]
MTRPYRAIVRELPPAERTAAVATSPAATSRQWTDRPGLRRNGAMMAEHGIYDLRRHHEEVVPVLEQWQIFERDDFGPRGEQAREQLAGCLDKQEKDVLEFEEQRDRPLARARRREPWRRCSRREFVAGQQNSRPDSGEGSLRSSD